MEDMFDFLDSLRESGQINMFGAAPVLVDVFEINKFEAREVLAAWMKVHLLALSKVAIGQNSTKERRGQ